MTNQEIISLITGMYMWFNQIADPNIQFKKGDLERHFTSNFVMEMNDKIITNDYETLFTHFEKFRKSGYQLQVQFPFQEVVISEDKKKCIVRYNILKISPANEKLPIKVIAIFHISNDKRLQRMNEVAYFDTEAISNSTHK